ncbi:DMT family transporter [Dictyobacter arantiisoli]|uniref:Membrane protein n=1 Tax=Dictyobacter arantiisoli TaxID=2014874 RepID=A0A5A5TKG5_9CHLR|nr:multidrug resistance efflux transporter family protein [Dictyobacter arantiisoli]GCF11539.1 membrane protein [Dictyobacter arantiisoli]
MKPIILGVVASGFFAISFILNHAMNLAGGSWIWSASLRFIFMLPFLLIIVLHKKNLAPLLEDIRVHFGAWFVWSMVGFGFFYIPLCFASGFAPGWLIAGTWQVTIVAGTLLTPLFTQTIISEHESIRVRRRVPLKELLFSSIILLGVAIMQIDHAAHLVWNDILFGILPVAVAAFAYPLGNRKMMEVTAGKFDVYQRVLGMTLCSLPLWLGLFVYGLLTVGPPSAGQSLQALIVAISSGVIATSLFFTATDKVKHDIRKLATVEATQAGEVLFTLLGEVIFFAAALPSLASLFGILLIIGGMVVHSLCANKKETILTASSLTEI